MVTINVSKISVRKAQEKMYSITLNLLIEDGGTDLINRNFSENHKIGNSVDYTVNKFRKKMQKVIDDYQEEQNILNSTQLDSAIETLGGELEWQ